MNRVLNFGSLNVDYTYKVDHMVKEGETQASEGMEVFLGGKGFNQSVALAKAGVNVYHAGMIGDDGDGFLTACKEYGIQTEYIKQIEGKGGHTIIQIDKNAQNSILLYGGSNRKITKEFVDDVLQNFEKGDYILLQNEISNVDHIIEKAYERGMTIILNPSPYDDRLDNCDMSKISYFILNEIEGGMFSGKEIPDEIIDVMLKKYPNARIILTLGSDGAVYADASGIKYRQPAFPVEAVDTTAAGDTFTGYFIAGILNGLDISINLKKSAKASSIAVTRKGAAASIPYDSEVVFDNVE